MQSNGVVLHHSLVQSKDPNDKKILYSVNIMLIYV
jgi:hypothetical protein